MTTEIKSLVFEKMEESGQGLARLADLSAVDHDGDTYTAGAFAWKEGGEQWAPILPAHNRRATPLGKTRVFERDTVAYAEIHLNLDTIGGKDWHSVLKFDLSKGKPAQEWSYGFDVLDYALEQRAGERVRVLKRLDVHEVSPVIRGAGAGTATLSMKSRGSFEEQLDEAIEVMENVIERAGGVKALRERDGRSLGKDRKAQLEELKRLLDDLVGDDVEKAIAEDPEQAKALADFERLAAEFETRGARRRWACGND